MDNVILQVEDLHCGYGPVEVIKGVSLTIKESTITALVGPNGAGKTTLLQCIMGYLTPSQGKVVFDSMDLAGLDTPKIAKLGIGYVPQGHIVFPDMTVMENLEMGDFCASKGQKHSYEMVFELFPRLQERKQQKAGTLSGGEQQMLAIGRALMSNPKLILVDEPSLGLAPYLVDLVFETLAKLKKTNISCFLVEQNAMSALDIADYAYGLDLGEINCSDEPEVLMSQEEVRKVYLGM